MTSLGRTAETGTASTVHEPFGKPSGPGLFHHKGLQLPPYIQHVAHKLVAQGHDESKAIEIAVGVVKNWAEGHDGHGNRVHPDVQAAAAKNIAQWEADKARSGNAGRSAVADTKPYGDVTYADPENGKYPLDTEEHIRAAWSYINMPKNAAQYSPAKLAQVKAKIRAAMKRIGADVSDSDEDTDSGARMTTHRPELVRWHALEDIHIISRGEGDGSGRVVEAFAAVFDEPAEIKDFEGHYLETIDRSAFNKRLEDLKRSRSGFAGVKCMWNHGMTIHGTPSERFSMPVGTPVHIEATSRGLLTRTEYNRTPLAEEVLELIRSGAVSSQSFTGRIVRSDPQLGRGRQHSRQRDGSLPMVRRTELGLKEYGAVVWPAYDGAEILGVRMSTPGNGEPDDVIDEALLPDVEAAAGEPLTRAESDEHSARYHQHALYALRSRKAREEAGLVW